MGFKKTHLRFALPHAMHVIEVERWNWSLKSSGSSCPGEQLRRPQRPRTSCHQPCWCDGGQKRPPRLESPHLSAWSNLTPWNPGTSLNGQNGDDPSDDPWSSSLLGPPPSVRCCKSEKILIIFLRFCDVAHTSNAMWRVSILLLLSNNLS